MCLAATNDLVVNSFHAAKYAPDQLLSHCSIKFTTSSIILGNSPIVTRSSSDVGTSLSLSSWPARIRMPSASPALLHETLFEL